MKAISIVAMTICAALCPLMQGSGPTYILTDLGPIGPNGQVLNIAANGVVAGAVQQPDNTDHAVLFYRHERRDISRPGIGGRNSLTYGVNIFGQAVGGAETDKQDPGAADFCGFQTLGLSSSGAVCAAFFWQNGLMKKLPTLGGNNGSGSQINRWGVIAGEVENSTPDPGCPQRYQFKPVKWQQGNVVELPTYPGDPDGVAYAINDLGQVVGSTGRCAPYNPNFQLAMIPAHPMLWEADGSPRYLGTLGGTGTNPDTANLAIGINNKGHVVGGSAIGGDETGHAFLWTREKGMQDLGTLPGDFGSGAIAINDTEQISGVSIGPDGPRAFVWQNGSMNDLNDLIQHTSLHLLFGAAINSEGQVAGIAVDTKTGEMHGYVASPQSHRDSAEDGAEPWFSREDVRQILARLRALNGRPIRFAPRK